MDEAVARLTGARKLQALDYGGLVGTVGTKY